MLKSSSSGSLLEICNYRNDLYTVDETDVNLQYTLCCHGVVRQKAEEKKGPTAFLE